MKHLIRSQLSKLILNYKIPKPPELASNAKILKNITLDKSTVITRADKGRLTVIMDKQDCTNECLEILNDTSTYSIIKKDMMSSIKHNLNS